MIIINFAALQICGKIEYRMSPSQPIVQPIQQNCCRICLQFQPKDQLLSPCICNGSTRFVHEGCLMQWASRDKKVKFNELVEMYELQCEICKHNIPIQMNEARSWRSCHQIGESVKQSKIRFIFQVVSIISCLSSLFYFVTKYIRYDQTEMAIIFKYLVLTVIVMISLISVFMIVNVIFQYTVEITEKYQIKKDSLPKQGSWQQSAYQIRNPVYIVNVPS